MSEKNLFQKFMQFAASYGVSIVLLFLLFVLVLVGTLEQVDQGLYMVQKKYFESFIVMHHFFNSVPVPLPGAYTLLALLTVNLILGSIFRAPKNWKRPGMVIAHLGILYLLVAGFVTFHYSTNGHMTLYENQQSNMFESYYEWEITVTELESGKQFVFPHESFMAGKGPVVTLKHPAMPFELRLSQIGANTNPGVDPQSGNAVLTQLPRDPQAERNIAGAVATIVNNDGEVQSDFLWGLQKQPWVVTVDGAKYAVDLHHRRWVLPFTIRLDKFTRDLHPGTRMAANYMSDVTMIEDGVERQINIRMNAPLRHMGYTFFQSSWGPSNAGPNTPLYSVFSVVKNPADQWPLYACIVISFGLVLHFLQKLLRYLRQQQRKMA